MAAKKSSEKRRSKAPAAEAAPAEMPSGRAKSYLELADGNGFVALNMYIDHMPLPQAAKTAIKALFYALVGALLLALLAWPLAMLFGYGGGA